VPYRLAGQQVTVRADGTLVKIYHRGQVIRTHPQQPAGGRASDPADFPPGTDVYARRDVDKLAKMAAARGEAIGICAARILDTPLPWTRMRAVYALIGLARTYGNDPVEQACAAALELDVISVAKIKSIVEKGTGRRPRRPPRAAARSATPRPGSPRPGSPATRASSPPRPASACRCCPAATTTAPAAPDGPAAIPLISSQSLSLRCALSRFVPPCHGMASRKDSFDDVCDPDRDRCGDAGRGRAGQVPVPGMRRPGPATASRRSPRTAGTARRCWSGTPR
jgi:hypothetical protein